MMEHFIETTPFFFLTSVQKCKICNLLFKLNTYLLLKFLPITMEVVQEYT